MMVTLKNSFTSKVFSYTSISDELTDVTPCHFPQRTTKKATPLPIMPHSKRQFYSQSDRTKRLLTNRRRHTL